jgi:uncharacterized protein YbjT (DUF2867 family)
MELQNRLVAVTGASGMLGVYISRALLAAGARVRGVVRNPKKAAFSRARASSSRRRISRIGPR